MTFDRFTKMNPIQKTIRFELKPVGCTLENLEKSGLLESDFARGRDYAIVKSLVDDYHRRFVRDCLNDYEDDWKDLAEAIDSNRNSTKDSAEKNRKELDRIKEEYRKRIVKCFKADSRFSKLGTAKLFSELMKEEYDSYDESEKAALDEFSKFSGYFIGLHQNRMNMYADDGTSTAIATRIVDQNFARFYQNCIRFDSIKKTCPEIIEPASKELGIDDVASYFEVSGYNKVIDQDGIEQYNYILGGRADSEKDHVRGLNQFLNEYSQNNPDSKRIMLQPLYKFILSERKSKSFQPILFESDEEVKEAVKDHVARMKESDTMLAAQSLVSKLSRGEFDDDGIYIQSSGMSRISQSVYRSWDALEGVMRRYYADELGDPGMLKTGKKIEKKLSSKKFRFSEVKAAISFDEGEQSIDDFIGCIMDAIESAIGALDSIGMVEVAGDLRNSEESDKVRSILEPQLDLLHLLKTFSISSEESRDERFYQDFDIIYDSIYSVVRLYNKVRNYCTRKPYSTDKIKLNFGNPTLCNGWSVSKERDNTSVLFRKGRQYYLGIMDPRKKVDFSKIPSSESNDCYEKMEYYYLTNPVRMLPKVFFGKKWLSQHAAPEHILEGYESNKNAEDKVPYSQEFQTELIKYYQDCIHDYHEWDVYGFKMKRPEEYQSLKAFFDDLNNQGYILRFKRIGKDVIDDLVQSGSIFLFRLHNKDFAEGSSAIERPSSANLHTLYWQAAFSEENLRDSVIKLNGEGEIFYRRKSIDEPVIHRKGSTIVPRRDKDGAPIPDHIYYEIFRYLTGQREAISPEAKQYLDRIDSRAAPHDIIKDRRFTVDKLFLHVSLTFNHLSGGTTPSQMNSDILRDAIGNDNLHFIGIDRGERNLIYICLIDGRGRIIRQKSLNIISNYDYRSKLDQREKQRQENRRDWSVINGISELKEGYISNAIHEVVTMAIENDAMIVMEDLNYGFKHSRTRIEKQVYQRFETALLNKLSHLVIKSKAPKDAGGVLNAYQLSPPQTTLDKVGKQSGIVLYVPSAYTSQIDPSTGFMDAFVRGADTVKAKAQFIESMDSIFFDQKKECFAFAFDYGNYPTRFESYRKSWTVYTRGTRIVYNRRNRTYDEVDPTEIMMQALTAANVDIQGELKGTILGDAEMIKAAHYAFMLSMRMRNSNGEIDRLISPICNASGEFYDSDDYSGEDAPLPIDADANGAYNIARKGLMYIEMCRAQLSEDDKAIPKMEKITMEAWSEYTQKGQRWRRPSGYRTSTTSYSVRYRSTTIIWWPMEIGS